MEKVDKTKQNIPAYAITERNIRNVKKINKIYLGRDKLAIFTITVYVNIIVYMYLYIDARAQVFSAI